MNVLHICANPRPIQESVSKQLAAAFFTRLAEKNPDVNVTNVDLYQNPPPFLTYPTFRCLYQTMVEEGYKPTTGEYNSGAYSRTQSEQLKQADVLVLTMPMWTFSMPAIMKAWLDQVLVPHVIFEFTPEGVQPLHRLKRIVLLIASADRFKENDPRDGLTRELRAIFEFIGVSDMAIAWADGQNLRRYDDVQSRKDMAVEAAQDIADEIAETATAET
ncbi:MAG: NAD(P)H-dependent oxidoreductase [Kiritimatiellaeota bacterium]|nr:NAD(P)H-dependent oxidoreductase [Kiritimatiellota bacterium]